MHDIDRHTFRRFAFKTYWGIVRTIQGLGEFLSHSMPRGIAGFLGLFCGMNLVGEWFSPGFDANLWWIDLPVSDHHFQRCFLAWSVCCFFWFAASRRLSRTAQAIQTVTFVLLFETSIWNAVTVAQLVASNAIKSRFPISVSSLITISLGLVLHGIWVTPTQALEREAPFSWYRRCSIAAAFFLCAMGFPVAQMYCYGGTDYRRPADVIVIFGSKVYADGEVSAVLEERLQTGCELYRAGFASSLLMSGGPSSGPVHETEAMRDRAIELGVPADAILLDRDGLNTQATAENTVKMSRSEKWSRILAVSQFYHLPRIKLAFHRKGLEVFTVPAKKIYHLKALPYFMGREVAALWMYFFGVW